MSGLTYTPQHDRKNLPYTSWMARNQRLDIPERYGRTKHYRPPLKQNKTKQNRKTKTSKQANKAKQYVLNNKEIISTCFVLIVILNKLINKCGRTTDEERKWSRNDTWN